MWQYTRKGYRFVEPDDDRPSFIGECPHCGGTIPQEPADEGQAFVLIMDEDKIMEGERVVDVMNVPRLATAEEQERFPDDCWIEHTEPRWQCLSCQTWFTGEEVWVYG